MKPRIFIGSSTEGLSTAIRIKDQLSDIADCMIWNETGFFDNNKSSFESLSEGATLFDFAILVATADDTQLKRDKLEIIARDNVIFEFGIYIGRLGRNRCFFLKERGLDLPSDLYGITLQEYKTSLLDRGKFLEEVCKEIKGRVLELWETFELSFVPSTVLAVGYFHNFLANVCRELMDSTKRVVEGKNYPDFKFHVVVPDELPNNFNDQVIAYLQKKKLQQMKVETDTRNYNFFLDFSSANSNMLELYDLPTTLSALKKAIEMAIPSTYIGESKKERILKQKEMNNFNRTLFYLVNENPITRKHVVLEFIDVK